MGSAHASTEQLINQYMMYSAAIEDHAVLDPNMASVDAVNWTEPDQCFLCCRSKYPSWPRIGHLQSCAPTIPIVHRLAAKLPSQSRSFTWLTTSDGTHTFQYRKSSAPWRTDCPACSVMADAIKVFWLDEKLRGRSYGWSGNHRLFNTQYPADEEHLEFFTRPGEPWLSLSRDRDPFIADQDIDQLPKRNPLFGNFSEEAMHWANKCIDRCDQKHPMCSSSSKAARLPTRVLDLEACPSQHDVRLVEKQEEPGRYICLSHCWGDSRNRCQTTKASLEANKVSIPVHRLPPSMQDAIAVTRKFSVRYLWIDSLCIVQDSLEDWSHQAGQMASIFENAFLTIGATSSKSDEEAFIQPLRTHLKLQVKTLEGTLRDLYVETLGRPKDQQLESSPLLRRAWCYQERLLSPRMLHFTKRELWWECRRIVDCECGQNSCHLDRYREETIMKEKPSICSGMANPTNWHLIVEGYSDLGLTFEKDKLPALSGLAQKTQQSRKDKYLAGLWSRTLVEDLCWVIRSPESQLREWRAPSWSWASVNGRVTWDPSVFIKQGRSIASAADVDLVACETLPLQEDQLGGVKSGFLTIRGKFSPVAMSFIEYECEPLNIKSDHGVGWFGLFQNSADSKQDLQVQYPNSSIFSDKPGAEGPCFFFQRDCLFDRDPKTKAVRLYKLRMYHDTEEKYGGSACRIGYMILRNSTDGSSNYERIGWGKFWGNLIDGVAFPEFLDGETEEVITII